MTEKNEDPLPSLEEITDAWENFKTEIAILWDDLWEALRPVFETLQDLEAYKEFLAKDEED